MVSVQALNGRIACKPLEKTQDTEAVKGFATAKRNDQLVKAEVLFQSNTTSAWLSPGETVYFRPEVLAHKWVNEIYEIDGQKVIFLPVDMAVARKKTVDESETKPFIAGG